jgi:hypothetical protein
VAAGERDENILQADVPGGEAGQGPVESIDRVEQGGDRAVRLGDSQRVSVGLVAGGEDGIEALEGIGRKGGIIAFESELDDVVAP